MKRQSKHQNPISNMTEILELSDWEFKITMICMLRALRKKMEEMQELMGEGRRKLEALGNNLKILEIKNITEIKNAIWAHQ